MCHHKKQLLLEKLQTHLTKNWILNTSNSVDIFLNVLTF